jgi:hypothetical protein
MILDVILGSGLSYLNNEFFNLINMKKAMLGDLYLKGLMKENINLTSKLTRFNVNDSYINDHVVFDPIKVNIELYVPALDVIDKYDLFSRMVNVTKRDQHKVFFEVLSALMYSKQQLVLQLNLTTLKDMVITNITVNQDVSCGGSFNVSLEQVKFATKGSSSVVNNVANNIVKKGISPATLKTIDFGTAQGSSFKKQSPSALSKIGSKFFGIN